MKDLFPYTPKSGYTVVESFNRQYEILKTNFLNAVPERVFLGYPIVVDSTHTAELLCNSENIGNYNSTMLHLTSSNRYKKFVSNCPHTEPCTGLSTNNCFNARYYTVLNGEERKICLYRLYRVHWIVDILQAANDGDENIKILYEDNKTHCYFSKKSKYGQVRYDVILEKGNGLYKFITGFPVTDKKTINRLEKLEKQQ